MTEVNVLTKQTKNRKSLISIEKEGTVDYLKEELSKIDLHISDLLHLLEILENKDSQPVHDLESAVVETLLEVSLSIQKATRKRRKIKNELDYLKNGVRGRNELSPSYRIKSRGGVQMWSKMNKKAVQTDIPLFIPSKFQEEINSEESKQIVDLETVNLPSDMLLKDSYKIQKLIFLFDIGNSSLPKLEFLNNCYFLTDRSELIFSSKSIEEVFLYLIKRNIKVYINSSLQNFIFKEIATFINVKNKLSKLQVFLERANNKFYLKLKDDILIENSKLSYILKRIRQLPLIVNYDYKITPLILESKNKYPELELKCLIN